MRTNRIQSATLALILGASLGPATYAYAQTSAPADVEVSQAITGISVRAKLIDKLGADALHISVEMMGTKAVLTGQVDKKESQELAKEVALSVKGVEDVDNRLTQNPANEAKPMKDIELEIKDAALESKVKNILLTEVGKNALKIEVEATNGAISLRGTVPSSEIAKAAVAKTKSISGVKKVINLLKTAS